MDIKVELRIIAIKSTLSDDPEVEKWSRIVSAAADEITRFEEALATTEAAYRREKERAEKLHTAIIVTLDENGHLADGDICTLKALKDAVGIG